MRRYKSALRLGVKASGNEGDKSAGAPEAAAAETANSTAGTLYHMSFALEQLGQIAREGAGRAAGCGFCHGKGTQGERRCGARAGYVCACS
jgi:hypothetical protein